MLNYFPSRAHVRDFALDPQKSSWDMSFHCNHLATLLLLVSRKASCIVVIHKNVSHQTLLVVWIHCLATMMCLASSAPTCYAWSLDFLCSINWSSGGGRYDMTCIQTLSFYIGSGWNMCSLIWWTCRPSGVPIENQRGQGGGLRLFWNQVIKSTKMWGPWARARP